ncbi:MAG: hypothetical protein KQI81_14110 [Deltaproteobacteria bacterium]|nr:hypothetical protein [Deltaproteobacteria bacterium]
MQTILNRTAMANNVAPQFLEFLGVQDERHTVGKILYHFHIQDAQHPRYRSTVTFMVAVQGAQRWAAPDLREVEA